MSSGAQRGHERAERKEAKESTEHPAAGTPRIEEMGPQKARAGDKDFRATQQPLGQSSVHEAASWSMGESPRLAAWTCSGSMSGKPSIQHRFAPLPSSFQPLLALLSVPVLMTESPKVLLVWETQATHHSQSQHGRSHSSGGRSLRGTRRL